MDIPFRNNGGCSGRRQMLSGWLPAVVTGGRLTSTSVKTWPRWWKVIPFPLTPDPLPKERRKQRQRTKTPPLPDVREADDRDSLSPRERVGVRGKGCHAQPQRRRYLPIRSRRDWFSAVLEGLLILLLFASPRAGARAADIPSPISISLTDQWEKPAALHAPLDRITILTVADRTGAEQINEWVAPLKVQFGTNVQFFAVADVSAVPGPLRGMVRRRFAKEYTYPIALDWKGTITGQLALTSKSVNLFVLDRSGTIQHTAQGTVATETLRNLINAVTRLLPPATESEVGERITTRASAP
jgi:hypothetical protein